MKKWVGLAGTLALGCSGSAVDIGKRSDIAGFVDAPRAVALENPTEPQTLFEGGAQIFSFTAEETTLYALAYTSHGGGELISCPLDRCESERTVLTRGIYARDTYTYPDRQFLIVGDWLLWDTSSKEVGGSGLRACPKTGCASPLLVTPSGTSILVTDGEYAYWVDSERWLTRWKPDAAVERLRDLKPSFESVLSVSLSVTLAGDYLYLAEIVPERISRVRKDGSEAPELVATRAERVDYLAVSGDALYYGAQILGGFIATCPLSDCDSGGQPLVSNQRWASSLQIAGTELFWLTAYPVSDASPQRTLTSCQLPDCPAIKSWVSGLILDQLDYDSTLTGPHVVVTTQYVLWREASGTSSALRRLPR